MSSGRAPEAREDYRTVAAAAERGLLARMRRSRVRDLRLGLLDGGSVVWSAALSIAKGGAGEELYRLGAISQLFTTVVVLGLAERGRLDLDAELSRYLPELELRSRFPYKRPITLRDILSHHSGLPGDFRVPLEAAGNSRFIIEYLARRYLLRPPGEAFALSSPAFELLALVVERAGGGTAEGLQRCLRERLLAPLGLRSTRLVAPDAPLPAEGDAGDDAAVALGIASMGVASTAGDLARFLALFTSEVPPSPKVLSGESINAMMSVQNLEALLDLGLESGLGWILSRPALSGGGRTAWLDGASGRDNALLLALPDQHLGMVLLSHTPGSGPAIGAMADEALSYLLATKRPRTPPQRESPPRELPAGISLLADRRAVDRAVGLYPTGVLGIVRFFRARGGYRLRMWGAVFMVRFLPSGWFAIRRLLFDFYPVRSPRVESARFALLVHGEERYLAIARGGLSMVAGSLYRPHDLAPEWSRRRGLYRCQSSDPQLPARLTLAVRRGLLLLSGRVYRHGHVQLVLDPIERDEAIVQGGGRFGGETLFFRSIDGAALLDFQGLLYRRAGRLLKYD